MSDEIVTQLREIQWEYDKTWQEKMSEAADEIERLRKELGIYQDLYANEIIKRVAGE